MLAALSGASSVPARDARFLLLVQQTTQERIYLPRAASQLSPRLDVE